MSAIRRLSLVNPIKKHKAIEEGLTLIGLGSKRNERLDPGVHLRWMFHPKIGLPAGRFKLYRSESSGTQCSCYDLSNVRSSSINLSEIEPVQSLNNDFMRDVTVRPFIPSLRLPRRNTNTQKKIILQFPSDFVELFVQLRQGHYFDVRAFNSEGDLVAKETVTAQSGLTHAYVRGKNIKTVEIEGIPFQIRGVCVWTNRSQNSWEEVESPNPWKVPELPEGFDFNDERGYVNTLDDASRILGVLSENGLREGVDVPFGFHHIKHSENGGREKLSMSLYDVLMANSMFADVSKMLRCYYIDNTVSPDKYYNYRIQALWPESALYRLDHQVLFHDFEDDVQRFSDGFIYYNPDQDQNSLYFQVSNQPQSVSNTFHESGLETKREIVFKANESESLFSVNFHFPVREVQVFLNNYQGSVKLLAYTEFGQREIDIDESSDGKAVLSVSGQKIKRIEMLGKKVGVFRIDYDYELLPRGTQDFEIHGLSLNEQHELHPPSKFNVENNGNNILFPSNSTQTPQHQFKSKLSLETHLSKNKLLAYQPFGYHVERKFGNSLRLINEKDPIVFKSHADSKIGNYTDLVLKEGKYSYRASSLDIFDRKSKYTDFKSVNHAVSIPAAPLNVKAKYLDYQLLNHDQQNLLMDEDEISTLRAAGKSGVYVSWDWSPELKALYPDVTGFNILFHPNWLNVCRAKVADVQHGESWIVSCELHQNTHIEIAENDLIGERVRVGGFVYIVANNTEIADDKIDITLQYIQGVNGLPLIMSEEHYPKVDDEVVINLTKDGVGKDFTAHESWPFVLNENIIDVQESKIFLPKDDYQNVINFPSPDLPKTLNEVGQIGVMAIDPVSKGKVSSPATIMASYRQAPGPIYPDYEQEYASYADVNGKSTYTFRWAKRDGEFYDIYRAVESTLIRLGGDQNNDKAYVKLNKEPISSSEFIDENLNGMSEDRYLYKLKVLDENGNTSPFNNIDDAETWDDLPWVIVPRSRLPKTPTITKIVGGDNQIELFWLNQGENILYEIYRADNKQAANDIRLMERIDASVHINQNQVSCVDADLIPSGHYFYRVVAVDSQSSIKSRASKLVFGFTADFNRPTPPEWLPVITRENGLKLTWEKPQGESFNYLVQRKILGGDEWKNASRWLGFGNNEFIDDSIDINQSYTYRLIVMNEDGHLNNEFVELTYFGGNVYDNIINTDH